MGNWLDGVQWSEITDFLAAGKPSLLVQLLALNTAFLIFGVIRRMRQAPNPRHRTHRYVQELLLLANIILLSENQYMPFIQYRIEPIIYTFRHTVM